jgi:hypothetical protein
MNENYNRPPIGPIEDLQSIVSAERKVRVHRCLSWDTNLQHVFHPPSALSARCLFVVASPESQISKALLSSIPSARCLFCGLCNVTVASVDVRRSAIVLSSQQLSTIGSIDRDQIRTNISLEQQIESAAFSAKASFRFDRFATNLLSKGTFVFRHELVLFFCTGHDFSMLFVLAFLCLLLMRVQHVACDQVRMCRFF